MEQFDTKEGYKILNNMISVIKKNKAYLSEIDGAIGDGDHGINMSKGFTMTEERLEGETPDLYKALNTLGRILLMEIGGSMGPLYGQIFKGMAKEVKEKEQIDADTFASMLEAAYDAVKKLGNAKVGDKTLVDTLDPAVAAFKEANESGESFSDALEKMKAAAEKGKNSTDGMVAKVGRSSRLGERSKNGLDAGATSCYLLLDTMATTIREVLQ